ncbi:carbohydrate-binding module family 13 protein [Calocera viscosa TUFC12733]|uniref:Carbohydrate-binding module family 13 protein n=1 Tax=Calocera viscosa (strain TUFC12733) TaxID=1330018 RepID=A0A167G751_CALVF|nr:carbohydrate-binding module family 13 protein [Calocera viscosa TUFC12733]
MIALASTLIALPLLVLGSPLAPRASSQFIQSNRNGQCLQVQGTPGDGTPVGTVGCGSGTSLWDISHGNGLVRLTGTTFCLDAGTDPHNNVPSKIWTCYPGLTQQQWYYTDDNRIAITGGNQCLDQGPTGPQTYQCTTGNTNQIWYTFGGPTTTTTTSTTATTSSTSASSSPTTQGVQLHPNYNNGLCLTVALANAYDGQAVNIANCFAPSSPYYGFQKWILNRGSGAVQLAGTNFCLDAGVNPHDGVPAKIWTCYPGLFQQTWYYTDDNRIAITGGDSCLDVTLGSQPAPGTPYGSIENVQTWSCTTGDTQQIWTV